MTTVASISGSVIYDAENRVTAVAGVTYTYDGDGRRVKKDQTSGSTDDRLYWYGLAGEVLQETNVTGGLLDEYIFFNGQRVARRRQSDGAVFYFFSDHLGSARVVTNASGTIVEESDFYPFGGERVITDSLDNNYKFTGKERDLESGLDYFLARHYGSNFGRFLQADPLFGSPGRPQSLNRYAYSLNNPLRFIDPTGMKEEESEPTVLCANSSTLECAPPPEQKDRENTEADLGTGDFLVQELLGVWDVTGGAVIGTVTQFATGQAAEGFNLTVSTLAEDPGAIGEAFVGQIKDTANAVASGDPRAIGQVVGTAALIAIPFTKAGPNITFSAHGPAHLEGTGLAARSVEGAIRAEVRQIAKGSSSTGQFSGRVTVQGKTIEYRAYTLENGRIHIGTYYPPE